MQERFALLRLAALMAPRDEDALLMQRMKTPICIGSAG
jgi:hypothetical protein